MASSNFVSWVNRTPVRDLTWPPPVKQWNTQFIRKALDDPDWISLTRVSFKRDAFSRNRRIAKDKANKIASSVRSKFWNSSGFQSNLNLLMRNSNFVSFSRHLIPHYFYLESLETSVVWIQPAERIRLLEIPMWKSTLEAIRGVSRKSLETKKLQSL